MKFFFSCLLTILWINLIAQEQNENPCEKQFVYAHPIIFDPITYYSKFSELPIVIDGKIDDEAWAVAEWSEFFQDIEGSRSIEPEKETRVKLLWDDDFLYIGAHMEEDHLWFTLMEKDDIIFRDDDFEIFIDPDGDGHNYFEIEINEYNAVWDLFLMHPYSMNQGQNHLMDWEAKGMKTSVFLSGSVNNPVDIDSFWSVEIAIPWKILLPFTHNKAIPSEGEYWRVNFSRVDWLMEIIDGKYVKQKSANGKIKPERNWVGSPIGYVNMHKPELWAYLVFQKEKTEIFVRPEIEELKWKMWQIYYSVQAYHKMYKEYPYDLNCIGIAGISSHEILDNIKIVSGLTKFEIIGTYNNETWVLDQIGLIRKITQK